MSTGANNKTFLLSAVSHCLFYKKIMYKSMNILKFDIYGPSTIPYGTLRALRTVPDNDMQFTDRPLFLTDRSQLYGPYELHGQKQQSAPLELHQQKYSKYRLDVALAKCQRATKNKYEFGT